MGHIGAWINPALADEDADSLAVNFPTLSAAKKNL
jgi:hypothetical protein